MFFAISMISTATGRLCLPILCITSKILHGTDKNRETNLKVLNPHLSHDIRIWIWHQKLFVKRYYLVYFGLFKGLYNSTTTYPISLAYLSTLLKAYGYHMPYKIHI